MTASLAKSSQAVRARNGRIQLAKDHINRLSQSAKTRFMDLGLSKLQLLDLLHRTLDVNKMSDEPHVHLRLVASRGLKPTPNQNPSVNVGLSLIVISSPRSKPQIPALKKKQGPKLITSHIRRGLPRRQRRDVEPHLQSNGRASVYQW
ncbi:hypothetical protein PDIP_20140 [Penicillium digitatum Pd1]|uniref:Uncharacterized protein n=1 Tax=Penicillium digitatum (strain Pd1 / CECT 20795) TaxID=1170230 RepID=K9GGF7_PEND1|nr:hypothetical protein PDIP_20140 [Penicillium digitatum Pd1]EKV20079.1 hypothetical protein PDIP_20140 [Penicillium digitatum Pd1]